MADKNLQLDSSGNILEVSVKQTSAGSGDAGKTVGLNSRGKVDPTMLDDATAETATASEDIAAGALINVWLTGGNYRVRNADNTASSKEAMGYAPSAIASGASGTVVFGEAIIAGLSGLTIGAQYFLGTVGGVTVTPPTTSTYILQKVGRATSATELAFIPGEAVIRA